MLKLTKTIEYALISLVHITENEGNNPCSAREIAEKNSIPYEILAKTLQKLSSINVIESIKGPKGGYKLSSNIDKINIIDFIEMLEGPIGLTDCNTKIKCDQECSCSIKDPMIKINDKIRNTLKNITLNQFTKTVR